VRRILTTLLITACAAGATSLAVLRTDKEIVIAADSRLTRFSSADSAPDMCKVLQTGNAIAAFVGLVRARGGRPTINFDAVGTVEAVLDEKGTLAEKAEQIKAVLGDQLEKVTAFAPRAELDKLSGFLLGVVIAGEDEYEPVLKLHYVHFMLERGGGMVSKLVLCPGEGCPRGAVRITAPPAQNLGVQADGVAWAHGYVQSQIDRGVPTIGGRSSLLRVRTRG